MHFICDWTSRPPTDTSSPTASLSWCTPAVENSALVGLVCSKVIYDLDCGYLPAHPFPCQPQKQTGSSSHPSWHSLCISEQEVLPLDGSQLSQLAGQSSSLGSSLGLLPGLSYLQRFLPEARPEGFLIPTSEWDFLVWLFTRGGNIALGSLSYFYVNSIVCVDVPPGRYRYTLGTE